MKSRLEELWYGNIDPQDLNGSTAHQCKSPDATSEIASVVTDYILLQIAYKGNTYSSI